MSTTTRLPHLERLIALLAAGLLAMTAVLATSSTASADDLNATSDDTLAEIEAMPWPEYSNGDFDIDIYAAKMLLDYGEIYPGELNLEFDDDLESALTGYQEAFDLPATGNLDPETWLHMRDLYFGQHQFRRGDTGPVVVMIQRVLNAKYNYHLATDGIYGHWTELAVRDVQEQFDIGVDGVFGPLTFRALITYQDYDR